MHSRRGTRKCFGECALTRSAYGEGEVGADATKIMYTTCKRCHEALCVGCLEKVATEVDKYAARALPHDVWHAISARAWRQPAGRWSLPRL